MGRFEVSGVLGRGGFGTVYVANDLERGDQAVLKELTPPGATRSENGVLNLESIGSAAAQRLRQRFVEEAKVLSRLSLRGVLPIRATFTELGTAFFATDFIDGAVTLERVLQKEGRFTVDGALDIVFQILETLEGIHAKGFLHRDIKPSNVLIDPKGEAYLIDFGAAREWHADVALHHTVLYTPGYAPPEQMSERARRGPATDLYALCATAYAMLTGVMPTPATDRLVGAALVPLRSLRPDVEPPVAKAIEAGLALRLQDRPQSVEQLRHLLGEEEDAERELTLEDVDATLVRLKAFRFARRECPSCHGVLEEPKPLKRGVCPLCQSGTIRKREIHERLCPVCKIAPLRARQNVLPNGICPVCKHGWLDVKRKGLLSKESTAACGECGSVFDVKTDRMTLIAGGDGTNPVGKEALLVDWQEQVPRSETVWVCEGCEAQMDVLDDGRWGQVFPAEPRKFDALYPEEWARVAAGYEPGAGNAECPSCHADYYLEEDQLTLLSFDQDEHGFGKEQLGRLMLLEEARWIGVGKESPHPGFACQRCRTEFDREGDYYRLIKTSSKRMLAYAGEVRKFEDWHRIGAGLPTIDDEEGFASRLSGLLFQAYESGGVDVDAREGLLWKGPARRVSDGLEANLSISRSEVVFGSLLKKTRFPFDAIVGVAVVDGALSLRLSGEKEPVEFEVEPLELTAALASGNVTILLGAENLAARIRRERGG